MMGDVPSRETAKNALLVEGPDDCFTIIHLLERHMVHWSGDDLEIPYIWTKEGIDGLLVEMKVLYNSRSPGGKLGIVADANDHPDKRWRMLRSRLGEIDIQLPEKPTPGGEVFPETSRKVRVGIWVMPNHSDPGSLEDFLLPLIPQKDLWHFARKATSEAKQAGAAFPKKSMSKAEIRTWLAWQKEPGLPYGKAMKREYFLHRSTQADAFVAWFRRLFLD
jgi:hypothetical protein